MIRVRALLICVVVAGCSSAKVELPVLSVQPIPSPADSVSGEPYLFAEGDRVGLSWTNKGPDSSRLLLSFLNTDGSWSRPATLAGGTDWFVNWADYPMVAVNGSGSVAHYLQKSGPGTFAYDVKVTSSRDGTSWSKPYTLHDDGMQAEHGFVSFVPYGDGYYVSWLDGRETALTGAEGHEGHHGEMTLRAARLAADGSKVEEWELDSRVCDCCQTSIAMAASGPVVVYRDRSDDEVRDISFVRFDGRAWSEPEPVFSDGWKIEGCPVNGPRIDARGDTAVVAWFSAPEGRSQVKAAFSFDGGASFNDPVGIDEGAPIGRVDVVLLDGKAAVSWMEGPRILAVFISTDGRRGQSFLVAESSENRASGFPQMALVGDHLFFAWTDSRSKSVRVAKAKM
jgi:hypothetical protein